MRCGVVWRGAARVKFAQATVRRKGQVQEVRAGGGAYGGESTGVKSRVSKSVRL
ncbi:hypothetical protein CHLNCDRAFT_135353 [Chlorella variabilis]|uniref:Sas10 C-terminal domain-containing protein n=1 Tax=Chlorella variabilis TaxID=554065 RepID=E1ZI16_CHLVA|nr:hypothetical protein CHLNCDRAFT_135353 [Chlorella variabilis]EFN54557.1 hypothetical protein CHLNCDRAFT_135353 [Chlorella variabilis]|eukprot:XP_005846659.1 hypothetical protein CHLNCDRAFT_135353 [Chlorella variabilis]